MINGLFDLHFRMEKIDKNGDPLVQLNKLVDWELFREPVEKYASKKEHQRQEENHGMLY
jgi:hypothetical protein